MQSQIILLFAQPTTLFSIHILKIETYFTYAMSHTSTHGTTLSQIQQICLIVRMALSLLSRGICILGSWAYTCIHIASQWETTFVYVSTRPTDEQDETEKPALTVPIKSRLTYDLMLVMSVDPCRKLV